LYLQSGETWKSDTCTTCKCYGDDVQCTKEQCIDPDCSPDESLVPQPGTCCPVCVLRKRFFFFYPVSLSISNKT